MYGCTARVYVYQNPVVGVYVIWGFGCPLVPAPGAANACVVPDEAAGLAAEATVGSTNASAGSASVSDTAGTCGTR